MRLAEEGEKPTKYFCSLESRNVNKTIPNVVKDDGSIVHSQEEILIEVIFFIKTYILVVMIIQTKI